jgi:hypothetical protein
MPRFQAYFPETGAHREEPRRLAVHQFHAVRLGHVHAADAVELHEFALDHDLGKPDQQVERGEVPLPQGDLERLHVQPVAGQHAGMVAPLGVSRRAAAARPRGVDNVVVHQRGRVDQLDHGAQVDGAARCASGVARNQPRREKQQGRAQPLPSGRMEVLADGRDGIDRCHALGRQLALHLDQVAVDEVEDLPHRKGLPHLA